MGRAKPHFAPIAARVSASFPPVRCAALAFCRAFLSFPVRRLSDPSMTMEKAVGCMQSNIRSWRHGGHNGFGILLHANAGPGEIRRAFLFFVPMTCRHFWYLSSQQFNPNPHSLIHYLLPFLPPFSVLGIFYILPLSIQLPITNNSNAMRCNAPCRAHPPIFICLPTMDDEYG